MINLRIIIYGSIVVGLGVLVVCLVVLYQFVHFGDMHVSFLDVGQGDAILISQGTNQILIDGGPDSIVLLEQIGKNMPFWDRNIEIVIATHPDKDHIDGLVGVFKNYSVDQFWHTSAGKDTSIYHALMHQAKKETNLEEIVAFNGLKAVLGEKAYLEVIYPFAKDVSNMDDLNNTSIAIILHKGNEEFYFGGDLSSEVEDILPIDSKITTLKVGHHGSELSTSELFLKKTLPRDVVISVGANNNYGHPHTEVLDRILSIGSKILRTDQDGTITYICSKEQCKVELGK